MPRLKLPNQIAYLPLALTFVRQVAEQFGFDDVARSQLEVAAEEAVTNVMHHGYDAEESPEFEIACEPIAGGIRVVVHETGIPFDPSLIPAYQPGESSGMGVFLMRSMVDDCSFHNLGPQGKETHLVKYLAGEAAQEAQPAVEAAAEPAPIAEKLNYEVRRMRDEEAIEISRCAYKSHGYSFFDDHIYYPERLVELNHSGDLISGVAVTEDNIFMGHAALLYQSPQERIAEMTFLFVNVEYRGQGVINRLNEFLINSPKPRELAGMYAYGVANHVFSQKALARADFHDCGILLATSPNSWKFKGIPGNPSQRISVVLSFRYMQAPHRLTIYAPPQHRAMIEKLYASLGATHEYREAELTLPALDTEIDTSVNPAEGCAEIFIARYGSEVVHAVRKLQRAYCLEQVATINLFLSLEDPATCRLAAEFEKLGFFFAGILPRARFGDALILQYLNNVDLDYNNISAWSEAAQELLDYIRNLDPFSSL